MDELDQVTGGRKASTPRANKTQKMMCARCNKITEFAYYSGGRCVCSICGYVLTK